MADELKFYLDGGLNLIVVPEPLGDQEIAELGDALDRVEWLYGHKWDMPEAAPFETAGDAWEDAWYDLLDAARFAYQEVLERKMLDEVASIDASGVRLWIFKTCDEMEAASAIIDWRGPIWRTLSPRQKIEAGIAYDRAEWLHKLACKREHDREQKRQRSLKLARPPTLRRVKKTPTKYVRVNGVKIPCRSK